jgi:hypothetical protein
MYNHGEGVARDLVEAGKWYRMAAEQGFAIAQHNLDTMYSDSEQNEPRAINVYIILSFMAVGFFLTPMIVSILCGIGANIFGYRVFPGTQANRTLMILAGVLAYNLVTYWFHRRGDIVPWWTAVVAAVIFIAWGSRPKVNLGGREMLFGAGCGIVIGLGIRLIF